MVFWDILSKYFRPDVYEIFQETSRKHLDFTLTILFLFVNCSENQDYKIKNADEFFGLERYLNRMTTKTINKMQNTCVNHFYS